MESHSLLIVQKMQHFWPLRQLTSISADSNAPGVKSALDVMLNIEETVQRFLNNVPQKFQKFGVSKIFLMFLKDVSHAHPGCIYLLKIQ